ncbi:DUF485 domain-containing protein [Corynebacterium lizhenjunii]|uniref:DUF485 domain-containing protein n=1 Tax=Corynebacterium lizhenjunii TaxID=2709394 RepID=A0A7T0KFC0_9CORY|nr:DUF485 domain-containing protein [Corynebacterium lizhenjunii]QPK79763.1 DUF485 domain-containing protein [Corynebacterium lizhenjunii]
MSATPVGAGQANPRREPTAEEFIAMRDSAQFGELRGAYRNFTFPMTVAFFTWYVIYVLAAVFAPDFMAKELFGGWNVGFLFGIAQFATTFIITWIYVKYANKNIEPRAAAIRAELEG